MMEFLNADLKVWHGLLLICVMAWFYAGKLAQRIHDIQEAKDWPGLDHAPHRLAETTRDIGRSMLLLQGFHGLWAAKSWQRAEMSAT